MKYASILLVSSLLGCNAAEPPPVETKGFANPELIVETAWLADANDVAIVDARRPEHYQAGHIPGAVNVPRNDTFDPDSELRVVGPPEQIAELFGSRGIDESDHVIVYDDGLSTEAARVFWVLEYYGHPQVSVLNGGFNKWKVEGREVSTDTPMTEPVVFEARAVENLRTSKEEMVSDLEASDVVMLDARAPEEYTGHELHSERGGHVPGAVNVEWTTNFTGGDAPVLRNAADLYKMYEDQGVTTDKRVHAY